MKKTIENLAKAFIGESQARNRYTIYAEIAKAEGYEQIAAIFTDTADQERAHAKELFELLQDLKKEAGISEVKVEATAPLPFGKTADNLKAAAEGEMFEASQMYPDFAKVAEDEGLGKIAQKMLNIAKAEEHHKERYEKLLKEVENGSVFKKKKKEVIWVCRNCGFVYVGKEAPIKCPVCDKPQSYYQLKCEEY
jgi:rubrerythrin